MPYETTPITDKKVVPTDEQIISAWRSHQPGLQAQARAWAGCKTPQEFSKWLADRNICESCES